MFGDIESYNPYFLCQSETSFLSSKSSANQRVWSDQPRARNVPTQRVFTGSGLSASTSTDAQHVVVVYEDGMVNPRGEGISYARSEERGCTLVPKKKSL